MNPFDAACKAYTAIGGPLVNVVFTTDPMPSASYLSIDESGRTIVLNMRAPMADVVNALLSQFVFLLTGGAVSAASNKDTAEVLYAQYSKNLGAGRVAVH